MPPDNEKYIPQNIAYGLVSCKRCDAWLIYDTECGDMPDECPNCGCVLDWENWREEIIVGLTMQEGNHDER